MLIGLRKSLGNHEFDLGVSGLTPFIESLTCPVLCANLNLSKSPELAKENNLKKSIVFDINGFKVGVIGYLTPDTKHLAVHNNVEYIDEIIAIKKEVKRLKKDGADILIAVGHSGYSKDMQIAREVDGIDLVIGGHTNTFLWNGTVPDSEESQGPYPTFVTQNSGKQVPVVQAYAYTKYLGRLHLVYNSKLELIKTDGHPIVLDKSIPQDAEVVKILQRYANDPDNISNKAIGSSLTILDGKSCRLKECNLGNLITDAIVHYNALKYKGEFWTDAPIAILQGGAIRSSISHAEKPTIINGADLLTVMPFGGILTKVTVTGKLLKEILEHSVSKYSFMDPSGQYLQVAGLRVVFDLSKPVGSRVIKVEARCSNCTIIEYFNLVQGNTYNMLVTDFMYNGGDGYSMFKNLPVVYFNYKELDCTEQYLTSHKYPVIVGVEGRTKIINDHAFLRTYNSASVLTFNLVVMALGIFTL